MIHEFMTQHSTAIITTDLIVALIAAVATWNFLIYMDPRGYWKYCDQQMIVTWSIIAFIFWFPILLIVIVFWSAVLSWWIWKQFTKGFVWLANYVEANRKDGSNVRED